jgi:hypothetical protein
VVRFVNYSAKDVEAEVELSASLLAGRSSACQVDLMERPIEGEAKLQAGSLRTLVRADSFATVLIR